MNLLQQFFKSKSATLQGGQSSLESAEIIIHIGSPKTGSSAIQKYCNNHRKTFLKYGVFYPEHGLDSNGISGGHWDLANYVVSRDLSKASEVLAGYLKQSKKNKCKLLISAESFFVRPDDLLSILPTDKFHIVTFFRHPIEAFRSHYNQGVKRHFSTNDIKTVASSIEISRPGISGEVLLKWADLIGVNKISLLHYSVLNNGDFNSIKEFCDLLSLPYLAGGDKRINTSYTPCALEFKRLLNTVLDEKNAVLNSKLDVFLQKYSDSISVPFPSLKQLIGDEIHSKMHDYYHPIVSRIANRFSVNLTVSDEQQAGIDFESIPLIWDLLKSELELNSYIKSCVLNHLYNSERSYSLVRLCEFIEIDFNEIQLFNKKSYLSEREISLIISKSAESADMLRELAKIFERSGDFKNALRVSKRALELRPHGPYLKSMVDRLRAAV